MEGCIEAVLSAMSRLFAPPPDASSNCGNSRSLSRICIVPKSGEEISTIEDIGLVQKLNCDVNV